MKATAGVIILNSYMPNDIKFPTDRPIDKKVYKEKLSLFATKYPDMYKERIHLIGKLGEKMGYYLGAHVGSDDLHVNDKEAEKHIKQVEKKISKAKNDDEKKKILVEAYNEGVKRTKNFKDPNNELLLQMHSAARGNPKQLSRMAWSPFYAVGMDQTPKTVLIKNNFNKGLNSQEYFAVASQGRFAAVQTANATSEPGELGKILIANADDVIITMHDCGTKNGVCYSYDDHHIVGRYEAGTNRLIDDNYWNVLKQKKPQCVKVRSATTCEAPKGICAMCYGLKTNGKLPAIGDNVGIEAAQYVGEPLTQMVLSTKHSTGAKEETDDFVGMEGFRTIVSSPDNFKQKGVMSKINGIVSRIDKAPQGGHYIIVNNKDKIYVPATKKVIVKTGDRISKGQMVSEGVASIKELTHYVGVGAARQQEADLLHKAFLNSTGMDINKKHLEVLTRGHLSLGKTDSGSMSNIDGIMKNYPAHKEKKFVGPALLEKTYYLAENIDIFLKGTEINEFILNKLKQKGLNFVEVTTQKPPVKPVYKTLMMRPNFNRGLFAKTNYRYLQKAITNEIKTGKGFKTSELTSDREKHTAHKL